MLLVQVSVHTQTQLSWFHFLNPVYKNWQNVFEFILNLISIRHHIFSAIALVLTRPGQEKAQLLCCCVQHPEFYKGTSSDMYKVHFSVGFLFSLFWSSSLVQISFTVLLSTWVNSPITKTFYLISQVSERLSRVSGVCFNKWTAIIKNLSVRTNNIYFTFPSLVRSHAIFLTCTEWRQSSIHSTTFSPNVEASGSSECKHGDR